MPDGGLVASATSEAKVMPRMQTGESRMQGTQKNQNVGVLDYQTPSGGTATAIWRWIRAGGPWFVVRPLAVEQGFQLFGEDTCQFFPDNRRVFFSVRDKGFAEIIDVPANRTLAKLSPVPIGVGGLVISNDGRHVALACPAAVQIFDQVGAESKWGGICSWPVSLLLLVYSVFGVCIWRDARRQSGGYAAPIAALPMFVIGLWGALTLALEVALTPEPDVDGTVGTIALTLACWTVPGLFMASVSRNWPIIGGLLLAATTIVSGLTLFDLQSACVNGLNFDGSLNVRVFENTWVFAHWQVLAMPAAIGITSTLLLVFLLVDRKRGTKPLT